MLTSSRQGQFCAVKKRRIEERKNKYRHHYQLTQNRTVLSQLPSFLHRPLHWPALEVVIPVLRPQTTTKITLFQEQCCRLIAHLPPHDEEDRRYAFIF